MKKASFTKMTQGTQEDYTPIVEAAMIHSEHLPERIIEHLNMLKDDFGGFAVDRYEHCLQTATRAYRDGRDEEYVVCALLHDIGDILAPANHADFAATLLEPYISEKNYWILKHHGIFQGYYFFEHLGLDKDMREQFRGHEHFEYTAQFCHLYDQCAFDKDYESMPLEAFEPMVQKVLAKPKASIYKGRNY